MCFLSAIKTRLTNGFGTLTRRPVHANAKQWANVPAAVAEHNVLSFMPYLQSPPTQSNIQSPAPKPTANGSIASANGDVIEKTTSVSKESKDDPYGPRRWHSNLVKLSGKNRALNELSVERVGEETDQNLVMLHGYGAGLGFFYKNFEGLSRARGWKLYALDLLGMGRSSRPAFRIRARDRQASITEAEDWFVDSLEEWRKERKLERFTLMGHSLGGYMAACYCLKYPGRVNKLFLVSPVGIPEDPYAVNSDLPEPVDPSIEAELTQDQSETTSSSGNNKNNFMNAKTKAEEAAENGKEPPRKPLPKWFTYLWDSNVSPFSLVRWSGPLGPRFVSGWTSRRFSQFSSEEAQALHTYAYTLFKQKGSGEYALTYVLAPGAYARSPLIRRIGGVGRQWITPEGNISSSVTGGERLREPGIPVVFLYGENDWMDVGGGYDSQKKLKEEQEKFLATATDEEKKNDNGNSKVIIIKKAGHHVYLDGWEEFNSVVLKELEDVRRRES